MCCHITIGLLPAHDYALYTYSDAACTVRSSRCAAFAKCCVLQFEPHGVQLLQQKSD